jgi:hypothetical protein
MIGSCSSVGCTSPRWETHVGRGDEPAMLCRRARVGTNVCPPPRMFEMFMLFSGYVASKSCECCKSRIDVAYVAMTLHECCINISDASSRGRGEGRGSPVPSRHAAPRCCHGRRCIHSSVRSPRHHHAWADA